MARIPKAPDEKVNHVKPVRPSLLPLHHNVKPPLLPKDYFPWTALGKSYWRRIWRSPMAVVFLDADIPGLWRMTALQEMAAAGMDKDALVELRQLEDRYGMSPLARRRLQFDIDRASGRSQETAEQRKAKYDDTRWLRLVDES